MSLKIRPLFFSILLGLRVFNVEAEVTDISRIYNARPSLDGFDMCFGGGCAEISHVKISHEEWQEVVDVFSNIDVNVIHSQEKAAQERDRIAQAVGVLEVIVGDKTGTAIDRAGTFDNSSFSGQLDCNDEAINTTSYIRLMRQAGLIQWHEVEDMRTRNFFFTGWPHTTAVIHEIANGQRYAVDSWFYDNGLPAIIVPFSVWKSGYIPEDSSLAGN